MPRPAPFTLRCWSGVDRCDPLRLTNCTTGSCLLLKRPRTAEPELAMPASAAWQGSGGCAWGSRRPGLAGCTSAWSGGSPAGPVADAPVAHAGVGLAGMGLEPRQAAPALERRVSLTGLVGESSAVCPESLERAAPARCRWAVCTRRGLLSRAALGGPFRLCSGVCFMTGWFWRPLGLA